VLVVCALVLVAAAFAYLVLGLVGGDVGDLYLSMVLCAGSLVVLLVSARVSRPVTAPAGDQPEPVAPEGHEEAEEAREVEVRARATARELATTSARGRGGLAERLAEVAVEEESARWAPPVAAEPEPEREVEPEVEVEAEPEVPVARALPVDFPIADYDTLAPAQVLSLVPKLWPEEAPVVAARERATRARPAVLDALAEVAGDPGLAFPIADYDDLATEQITALLDRLEPDDLDLVRAAERAGKARVGVLVAVANELAARA
jgi:hypothetical protein